MKRVLHLILLVFMGGCLSQTDSTVQTTSTSTSIPIPSSIQEGDGKVTDAEVKLLKATISRIIDNACDTKASPYSREKTHFYLSILDSRLPESVLKQLQRIEPSIRDLAEYKRGSGVKVRVGFVPAPKQSHELLLFVLYGRSPVGFRAEINMTYDGNSWRVQSNRVIRDM